MKKKSIIFILSAVILGFCLSKYLNENKNYEAKEVFSESTDKEVYLMQYGVYSSVESLNKNVKNLTNYIYYNDLGKYHVIIGITSNKDLKNKIEKAYGLNNNTYLKKITISNYEFLESLKQYDLLIKNTENNNTITVAEKQILSKYEELILNNE